MKIIFMIYCKFIILYFLIGRIFQYANVDFSPVYQCLHIHDILKQRNEFSSYYKENRKLQCDLALQLDSDFSYKKGTEKAERFAKYFNHVAAFYIIESYVYKTTDKFISYDTLEDLWIHGTNIMKNVIDKLLNTENVESLCYLLDSISLFKDTMKEYSYDVSTWESMLANISEICAQKSLEYAHKEFTKVNNMNIDLLKKTYYINQFKL